MRACKDVAAGTPPHVHDLADEDIRKGLCRGGSESQRQARLTLRVAAWRVEAPAAQVENRRRPRGGRAHLRVRAHRGRAVPATPCAPCDPGVFPGSRCRPETHPGPLFRRSPRSRGVAPSSARSQRRAPGERTQRCRPAGTGTLANRPARPRQDHATLELRAQDALENPSTWTS